MQSRSLEIPSLLLILPTRHADDRGYFVETWSRRRFSEAGIEIDFVQDNLSHNARAGTVAGLHFQRPPAAQAKLVSVLRGRLFDVAVDLREDSATFGKCATTELSADGGEQLLIPRGFAHGYCTLEDDTTVAYKVDAYYDPAREGGIRWNDPALGIDWPVTAERARVSAKDAALPLLCELASPFAAPA